MAKTNHLDKYRISREQGFKSGRQSMANALEVFALTSQLFGMSRDDSEDLSDLSRSDAFWDSKRFNYTDATPDNVGEYFGAKKAYLIGFMDGFFRPRE